LMQSVMLCQMMFEAPKSFPNIFADDPSRAIQFNDHYEGGRSRAVHLAFSHAFACPDQLL
jgi:hypothetical protein